LSDPAIRTRGLTKVFPPRRRNVFEVLRRKPRNAPFTALHGVDLEVRRGELFGLLGPNGAGKTTLVKILSTLLLPTEGEATVAGLDVRRDAEAIRQRVGVVLGGDRALYWRLSARENLWYFSQLYDMPGAKAKEAIERVLKEVDLAERGDERVENYSKGMKQRLHIARGLLTDPEILLLDEPTIGLDPRQIAEIRSLIKALAGEHTVILSTHILPEVSMVCSGVVIINQGAIVAQGPIDRLVEEFFPTARVAVEIAGPRPAVLDGLRTIPGVVRIEEGNLDGDGPVRLVVESARGRDVRGEIFQLAAQQKWNLLELRQVGMTLEEVFIRIVAGEEGAAAPGDAEVPA